MRRGRGPRRGRGRGLLEGEGRGEGGGKRAKLILLYSSSGVYQLQMICKTLVA